MFCGPETADVSRGEAESRVHKTYCFPRSQSISVNYHGDNNGGNSKLR